MISKIIFKSKLMAPLRSQVGVPVKILVKNVARKKGLSILKSQNNVSDCNNLYKILSENEPDFTYKDGIDTCLIVRVADY